MSQIKIWVDDVREAPRGWHWAKTYTEAVEMIETLNWTEISLDHDLGDTQDGREFTGYDVLLYIVEKAWNGESVGIVHIHTANPVGRERMLGTIQRYLG